MAQLSLEAVKTYLTGLGNTRDEVAEKLRERGIREPAGIENGSIALNRNCAVATAIRTEFEELTDGFEPYWAVTTVTFELGDDHISLPKPVREVVHQVDNDRMNRRQNTGVPIKYPFLLAELPQPEQSAE